MRAKICTGPASAIRPGTNSPLDGPHRCVAKAIEETPPAALVCKRPRPGALGGAGYVRCGAEDTAMQYCQLLNPGIGESDARSESLSSGLYIIQQRMV